MPIIRIVIAITCAIFVTPLLADSETDQAHRETVMNDLFAVITLSGQHCEKVIDFKLMENKTYVAICKNGARYRVGVTPEGAVQVGSHKD